MAKWRAAGYPGATNTTRTLLNWWFASDHRLHDGRRFEYYRSQREPIETLIHVYEVARVRTRQQLPEKFARAGEQTSLPPDDDFARCCVKMATGSGANYIGSLTP